MTLQVLLKRLCLILLFGIFAFSPSAFARTTLPKDSSVRLTQTPIWYFNALLLRQGTGLRGPRFQLATVSNNRHEWSLGFEWLSERARKMPKDGACATCHHGDPEDILMGGTLSYGYIWYPAPKAQSFRVVFRGGVLLGKSVVRDGFYPNQGPLPGNGISYNWTENRFRFAAALLICPTVELVALKMLGISVGPYAVLHPTFPAIGISISTLFGNIHY